MAAKLLLTDETHRIMVETVRLGAFIPAAAGRAGVHRRTAYAWIARGRADIEAGRRTTRYAKLVTDLERENGEFETRLVGRIQRAAMAGDWRAGAWLLSHRYPDRWADRSQVDVNVGLDEDAFREAVAEMVAVLESRAGIIGGPAALAPGTVEGEVIASCQTSSE
jgi:hypothetical protein